MTQLKGAGCHANMSSVFNYAPSIVLRAQSLRITSVSVATRFKAHWIDGEQPASLILKLVCIN